MDNLTYGPATPFGKPARVSLRSLDLSELNAAKDELRAETEKHLMPVMGGNSDRPGNRANWCRARRTKRDCLGFTTQEVLAQVRQAFFGLRPTRAARWRMR
ncbi:MAG: hypothetical protein IPM46_01095 [Flavobacteriales bacterium]|nr:hypothetical protein [Flavobacteriales bacterium]